MANVPVAPPGVHYVAVAASPLNTLLLRSDGQITAIGASGILNVPPLPANLRYTDIDCGRFVAGAVRSDGQLIRWGSMSSGGLIFPPLPSHLNYVEVACSANTILARRSDGSVVVEGLYATGTTHLAIPPPLLPGTSYLRLTCGETMLGAVVGRESSYVTFASGCSGSQPTARLVPRDTPQIGRTLEVGLLNLPASMAAIVMGWSKITPGIALDFLGMPGCVANVSLDGIAFLSGTGGTATWSLPIPYQPMLLGTRFYNQAFVFDPAAGNSMGAVVSDATEAIVGG